MDDKLSALVTFLRTTGFVNITCQTQFDPPVVQIDMPLGLGLSIGYNEYEQIREAAGLPEEVCTEGYTY